MAKRRRKPKNVVASKRSKPCGETEVLRQEVEEDSATSSSVEEIPMATVIDVITVPDEAVADVPGGISDVVIGDVPVDKEEQIVKIEEADSNSEIISVGTPSPVRRARCEDEEVSSFEVDMREEVRICRDVSCEPAEVCESVDSTCEAESERKEEAIEIEVEKPLTSNIEPDAIGDEGICPNVEETQPDSSTLAVMRVEPAVETMDILAMAFSEVFDHRPLLVPKTSSAIPVDIVKDIVRGSGRLNFSAEALAHISMDTTFAVKLLVQEANKFREAGKRSSLACADIDRALKYLAAKEPLFGLGLPSQAAGLLQEPKTLKVVHEKNQLVTPEMLAADLKIMSVPREPTIFSHWLITADSLDILYWPEKPFDVDEVCLNYEIEEEGNENTNDGTFEITDECYSEETTLHAPHKFEDTAVEWPDPSQLFERLMKRRSSFSYSELIHLRSQSCGLLTKELEGYFQILCSACLGNSDDKRNSAFSSLENDPNMIFLVSVVVSFIAEQTEYYVVHPNLKKLQILMTMAKHLMLNSYLTGMKQYLHLVLPAVMTCIVCSTVCANEGFGNREYEHHWQLRNYASDLLKLICDKHSNSVNNIKGRVIKVLKNGLRDSANKSTGTVYGILYALKSFGADVIRPEMQYIETVVRKQADLVLTGPITVDSTNRTNSVRIKDLITQMVQLVENNGAPKISKVKTRIVSKDHVPRLDNKTNSNTRPQPVLSRKPPPPRKPTSVPVKPSPIIPTGPRPMPIPRFPSLGPIATTKSTELSIPTTISHTQVAESVSSSIQKSPTKISQNIVEKCSPPVIFVHPSKIFHTYTNKTMPMFRPFQGKAPRQRPRPSSKQPLPRVQLPGTGSPRCHVTRTPVSSPRMEGMIRNPHPSPSSPSSPSQPSVKYVLVPLQKNSGVPSLDAINSLLQGQLPSNASILSPDGIFPVDMVTSNKVLESGTTPCEQDITGDPVGTQEDAFSQQEMTNPTTAMSSENHMDTEVSCSLSPSGIVKADNSECSK